MTGHQRLANVLKLADKLSDEAYDQIRDGLGDGRAQITTVQDCLAHALGLLTWMEQGQGALDPDRGHGDACVACSGDGLT